MTETNVTPPAVTGTASQGALLETDDGTWTFDLDYLTYTYRWMRCDSGGGSCVAIPGATSNSYTVQAADVGGTIKSEVTATEHAGSPPSPDPDEPGPISGDGYSVSFFDDFTDLDTDVWRLGAWYIPESPANYVQSGSKVTIYNHPGEGKQRDLMSKQAFGPYGYYEARMRYTRHPDAWASHWMMSHNWIQTGNCSSLKVSEIDVFEAFHNLENPRTWRSHSSTIHRNTASGCGMSDSFKPNWTNDVGFELADNWRTYACKWTPTTITTYVDGVQCKTWPVWDTTNQAHRVFVGIWSHAFAAELTAEVDWYRVWEQ